MRPRQAEAVCAAIDWYSRLYPGEADDLTSSEAKALRQAVRKAFGRTFNKQAASYVDADLVAEGRTRTMTQRYGTDQLNALHGTFAKFRAKYVDN